jgi:two-component system, NtrC family, response regulator HydG
MIEQDRYWKTVVNTIQDGLMIVDERGIIVSINDALEKMAGYSRAELIGKDCTVLNCDICPQIRKNQEDKWCNLFVDGQLTARRCILAGKDGRFIHALKNACILHDDNGDMIGAVETITDITELIEKDNQIAAYQRQLRSDDGFCGIIGASPAMRQVFDLIGNAAQSDAPVIILGESGTGKELAAKAIHKMGNRGDLPYIKVNCAAFTQSLLESELFGHVKGAYTGAFRNRAGRFENADSGDIFLDEIGDLPLATQIKLLRVLEEKIIERVGDSTPIPVDVRIITATNRDLPALIKAGAFREDLFFRINVIPIHLPSLRFRKEDIPLLAEFFFQKINLKTSKHIRGIGNDTMSCLMDYQWPGNVRELKSAFEYAFVTCQDGMIKPHHLPPSIFKETPNPARTKKKSFNREEIKRIELIEALHETDGNQSKAAEILGVSRVTVWNRMRRYGVQYQKRFIQSKDNER